ncbi:histone acetyltransferase 1 [Dermatophagoides farinae]|uniref:Histone acetyltransferase type B catalytic subunit n=2 Tax=Dermatophagoides farinae TaxID=6954 RepID=A0A922I7I4_DERFA|nr:histone acetyltransferase 1 [Dermatophagoides farinae]
MNDIMSFEFNAFENYVTDSNECVRFKLVTCIDDLIEDFDDTKVLGHKQDGESKKLVSSSCRIAPFKPDMTYQFFGENENIFGYKDLTVKVYYSCAQLNIYLCLKYADRLTKQQTDGIEPDDVLKIIASKYETKVCYNLNEFSANLSKEQSFMPYGELMEEFEIETKPTDDHQQAQKRHFCLFKANNSVPGFVAYHERMQTFLMWFIEGASYIEIDDDHWDFFVLYEKLPFIGSQSSKPLLKEYQYCFVGYSTVYRYYAYPQNVRPRISQFLILPSFQRIGLGSKLLASIYTNYNNKSIVDITVEDPSDDFQRMRDIYDCKLSIQLNWYKTLAPNTVWSNEMAREAQMKFKLNPKQTRRVFEILKLKLTNRNDPEQYRQYRMGIKQRLNAPYKKQINDIERLRQRKAISETNYTLLMKTNQIPREYRIKNLNKQYEEIESEYLQIIEKLG